MIYYPTWKQLPDHPGKHTMLHWSPPSYRWQEVVFCIIQPFTMSKNNKNKTTNEPLCKKVNANRTVSMLAGTPLLEDGTMVCVNVLSADRRAPTNQTTPECDRCLGLVTQIENWMRPPSFLPLLFLSVLSHVHFQSNLVLDLKEDLPKVCRGLGLGSAGCRMLFLFYFCWLDQEALVGWNNEGSRCRSGRDFFLYQKQ